MLNKSLFFEGSINDNILDKTSIELIQRKFTHIELSTTDGDKSTIGFINDCVSRLTWEFDNQKPTINKVRKYVENHYNNNPIQSKNWKTPIVLMKEKMNGYP